MQTIIDLRLSRGLSQEELAKKIGVNAASVSRWEKGCFALPRPTLKMVRAYDKLGIDYRALLKAYMNTKKERRLPKRTKSEVGV